jgi:hypothetical protein
MINYNIIILISCLLTAGCSKQPASDIGVPDNIPLQGKLASFTKDWCRVDIYRVDSSFNDNVITQGLAKAFLSLKIHIMLNPQLPVIEGRSDASAIWYSPPLQKSEGSDLSIRSQIAAQLSYCLQNDGRSKDLYLKCMWTSAISGCNYYVSYRNYDRNMYILIPEKSIIISSAWVD